MLPSGQVDELGAAKRTPIVITRNKIYKGIDIPGTYTVAGVTYDSKTRAAINTKQFVRETVKRPVPNRNTNNTNTTEVKGVEDLPEVKPNNNNIESRGGRMKFVSLFFPPGMFFSPN